ncbi:DUF1015 domain-containing protein [Nocardioides sp. W3-2-3]|nr:DUF1015 domain-containing protein [Nocardioides convexus]
MPWTSHGGPRGPPTAPCCPTRASTRPRPTTSPTGCPRWSLNPAPILLVHRGSDRLRDLQAAVAGREPQHAFTDRSEQQHRIWAIRDTATLASIAEELAESRALIADGHHRYAAYLRLQRRQTEGTSGPAPTDFGLAMLVDQGTTPLFLGPIHRTLAGTGLGHLRDAVLSVGLAYEERSQADAVAALSATRLAATDGERWAVITLDPDVREAAVETLHRRIVPALPHGPSALSYHHSVEEALAAARRQDVSVLMPAPSVDLVIEIAEADRLLPEKATSFQPKPSLGVLIRSLRDEPPAPR